MQLSMVDSYPSWPGPTTAGRERIKEMAFKNGRSYFNLDNQEPITPEQYIESIRQQIETMHFMEQLVAKTVLIVGQAMTLALNNKDFEIMRIMKEEIDKLFAQADWILNEAKNLQ